MMARGSADGLENGSSLVATSFTQSVDPGSGTSSTLMPPFSNQPILVAIANGDAAELTVLAHQPTRTVSSCALAGQARAARASVNVIQASKRCITERLLC